MDNEANRERPPCRSIFWTETDLIDEAALARGLASALPQLAFHMRYEHPMPTAVLKVLGRIEETNEISWGRPVLVPSEE